MGIFALTSVNVLQSIPDIFGTESVTDNGSELTIVGSGLENPVMTKITAFVTIG